MKRLFEKLNKISLPATLIIASLILGGFYFASQVNKQSSIEKQQQVKIKTEKQEQFNKETKEQEAKWEAKQALDTCISNAKESYHNQWNKECKAQGKLTNICIDVVELSYDKFLKKYEITSEDYVKLRHLDPKNPDDPISVHLEASLDYIFKRPDECSCRLITSKADRFNETLEKNKAECFKKYPQK